MLRKIQFFIGAAALLSLTACGGSESDTSASDDLPTPTESAPVQSTAQVQTPLERGKIVYKRCQTCHTLGEGEPHRVGPNLWGVVGREAAQAEGFNYSTAMEESGVVWTDENLSAYLEKPAQFMPGNRMAYIGLRKAEDRDAVIAYLKEETTP